MYVILALLCIFCPFLTAQPEKSLGMQPSAFLQKIQQEVWHNKIFTPHPVCLYYGIFDSPERQIIRYTLESKWKNILPMGKNSFLDLEFCENLDSLYLLQNAKDAQSLPPAFLEQHRQYEVVASLIISENERYAKLRCLDIRTGHCSPMITIFFQNIQEMIEKSAGFFLEMIGCEGYLVQNNDKTWIILFRGISDDLVKIPSLQTGSSFAIFFQNRRLADSFFSLQSFIKLGKYYFATAEYKGNQSLQAGLKVAPFYFTGGTQKFRLTNQVQAPQNGFSVFASYQNFSTDNKDYIGTTSNNGEFSITDTQKKPIFLSIAKNVEGITFAFYRRMIIVQDSSLTNTVETIVVADQEIAEREAEELTPENIRKHKAQEAKRMLIVRLEQAREHLHKKELPNALIAIKSAQQFLRDLPDEERFALSRTLKDVEEIYEKGIQQKKANEDLTACYKLLDEMDQFVAVFQYESAQTKLEQIKNLWPQTFYEKEFEVVNVRETRLAVLKQEANTSLGQARQYLAQTILKMNIDQINHISLQKIYPYLKIIFSQGCMDEKEFYNDKELWLKVRLHLNQLSQTLAQQSQEYLADYKKATSVQSRTNLLDKHQKSYQYSKVIDEWLQQMQ